MPNTKIEYLYRDAGNYKQYNTVVLSGVLTLEEYQTILVQCAYEFFPSKVGLEDLQHRMVNGYDETVDHPCHELLNIDQTEESPTVDMEAKDFLSRVLK